MRRKYLEVYRLSVDALVTSGYSCRFSLDLLLYLGKILEFPAREMVEFCPFMLSCHTGSRVRDRDFMSFGFVLTLTRNVNELENQRPPCDNAASSWKEVSTDNIFKYRRLAR